jgi:hypothetical protein
MLANVALSHNGLFGETTAIIDRCIFESCVKIAWLCRTSTEEPFTRFIADGLKTELSFKTEIEGNINARNGNEMLAIEKRMLSSISRHLRSSGLTDEQIEGTKKLPDLATMIDNLGQGRLTYIVGQKIGSHHIHGTWPSLRLHYLEESNEGVMLPRDHDCPTHVNQYFWVSLVVLDALSAFITFILETEEDILPMVSLINYVIEQIQELNEEVVGNDFEIAEGS